MIRQRTPIKRSTTPIARESENHKARRLAGVQQRLSTGATPTVMRDLRVGTKPRPKRKRTAAEERERFARIYGSEARVLWMKQQQCIACHRQAEDGHHIVVDGMGRKASYTTIVPLCRSHHDAIHHHGPKTFAALVNVDLVAWAAEIERRWQAHLNDSSNGVFE